MGIKLSLSDQLILLRHTAKNIDDHIKYLAKVDFDEQLLDCATKLITIGSVIDDSRVFSIKAENKVDTDGSDSKYVFNERRIWE